jgi:hypothetical protein
MAGPTKTKSTIDVGGSAIAIRSEAAGDYISLTDIAKSRSPEHVDDLIRSWLGNRNTIELLGAWERLNNAGFDTVAFDEIRSQSGLNVFTMTPGRWIADTGAIGIVVHTGRKGGTFAHPDIAFEFASWISAEFRLYLIREFQHLKADENARLSHEWSLPRTLSKINYRIQNQAIKAKLIPPEVSPEDASATYSAEADILNTALFGQTASEWREANPGLRGNMRDYATVEQLLVLANLEIVNAELIHLGMPAEERLKRLNEIAIRQMRALTDASPVIEPAVLR